MVLPYFYGKNDVIGNYLKINLTLPAVITIM